MTAILLLAGSFVRQNWWLLLVFLVSPLVFGMFLWSPHHTATSAEVLEIVRPETLYGLLIITFLASSAIHNEKRSRRILGVLSKAVTRMHYLLGFLTAATWFAVVYFIMIDLSIFCLLGLSIPLKVPVALWFDGIVTSIWAVSLGLMFSTFSHPFIAATLAGAWTFAPMTLAKPHAVLAPVAALIQDADILSGSLHPVVMGIAFGESVFFMLVGSAIFSRMDVTTNLE